MLWLAHALRSWFQSFSKLPDGDLGKMTLKLKYQEMTNKQLFSICLSLLVLSVKYLGWSTCPACKTTCPGQALMFHLGWSKTFSAMAETSKSQKLQTWSSDSSDIPHWSSTASLDTFSGLYINFFGHLSCRTSHTSFLLVWKEIGLSRYALSYRFSSAAWSWNSPGN